MPHQANVQSGPNDIANQLRQVTEAAAAAVGPLIGSGDKIAIDRAAVEAMDQALSCGRFCCQVVIGEGVKDGAPMLVHGKRYGLGEPEYKLAADPVEGTTFAAEGSPGSMALLGLSTDRMLPWMNVPYAEKLAVGPGAADLVNSGAVMIGREPASNMLDIAKALDKPIDKLTIAVLDRPRNESIITAARNIGARVVLLRGGDVLPILQACVNGEIDMLYGSGGTPEAVISAAAAAALGGGMQARLHPQNQEQAHRAHDEGLLGTVLHLGDLVGDGEVHFSASGITDSSLLQGVRKVNGLWTPGASLTASRVGSVVK